MAKTNDIKAARDTYEAFIRVVKIATPVIALLAALVIYLLSH